VLFDAPAKVIGDPNIKRAIRTLNHVTKLNPGILFGQKNLAESGTLLNFLVAGVFSARIAEFRRFQPLRMLAAVLGRRIVPVFTIIAL
jgi:hypothetical protein